ncbi:MAG: ribonuclease III [Phycisphaerales bacterium]|nr:ribonuclease III [Phycisphaerales bacterium]
MDRKPIDEAHARASGEIASLLSAAGSVEPAAGPGIGPGIGLGSGEVTRHPVETLLGHTFADQGLLEQALRHASMTTSRLKSNERLEFLGDAVLGLVVCQMVFERFPHLLEGEMTKIKSAVVSRETCAAIGKQLGLEAHLSLGKGMKGQHTLPKSLSAAAVEAMIAAIYLDGGLSAARAFIEPLVAARIDAAASSGHQENYKSLLQQFSQQTMGQTPTYTIVTQRGPDHAKEFHVRVELDGRVFDACWGASKKQAEQAAALAALVSLGLARHVDGGVELMNPGKGESEATPDAGGDAAAAPGEISGSDPAASG